MNAGFIYNISESTWHPTSSIVWLGIIWDLQLGTLKVLDRRINKLHTSILSLLQSPVCKVRDLHSFVGQIISLSPVIGNVTRLMTRNCQSLIALVKDEDSLITPDVHCLKEITFWQENVSSLNNRTVFLSPKVNKIICTDAVPRVQVL